jgi:ketosteroid isomerase-like protein
MDTAGAEHGSSDTPTEIVAQLAAAVVGGDLEGALELIAPDAIDHAPLPGAPPGRDGWLAKWQAIGAARQRSSLSSTVEQRVASGDTVATRYAIRTSGDEPVGYALDMIRVRDGQIVEHWGLPLPAMLATA